MRLLVLTALAGCSFQGALATGTSGDAAHPNDGEAGNIDAAHDGNVPTIDAAPDAFVPVLPCGAPDTNGLVLCLEFDDATLTAAKDGSGLNHDATVANVSVTSRTVPTTSQAVQVLSTTAIQVGDTTDLDLQTFTLMAWVHRENTPGTNGSYGLIDTGGQYALTIDDTGKLICGITTSGGTEYVGQGDLVVLNEWDLVACTRDFGAQRLSMYVFRGASGTVAPLVYVATHTATTTTLGTSIGATLNSNGTHGSQLAGKLDSVRIFNRVLTTTEICVGAGRTGC
jgi:hypothetical protein